ncbi:hypothetical protein HDU91_004169, partial [Kappamyces sp. JEL0680]
PHTPVLLQDCLRFLERDLQAREAIPLALSQGEDMAALLAEWNAHPLVFVDATFGFGGYSRALLDAFASCKVLAIDQDPVAIERAWKLKESYGDRLVPIQGKFGDVAELVKSHGHSFVDACLFDIGVSSMQLDEAHRGFSFVNDGPLDMRMPSRGNMDASCYELPAHEVVNSYSVDRLADIIYYYGTICVLIPAGEERQSRKIARAIERERTRREIKTTGQLAQLVADTIGYGHRFSPTTALHPATKTFQALRIYVNDEMSQLYQGLQGAASLLRPGGLCLVVTFHSLEDRLAKRFFRGELLPGNRLEDTAIHDFIRADPARYRRMRRTAYEQESHLYR